MLLNRDLFSSAQLGRRENGEPTAGPTKYGTCVQHPRKRLRGGLVVFGTNIEQPLGAGELAQFTAKDFTPPVLARAQALREKLARGERPAPLACPVQVVQFGGDLTLVAIAGEATVDYSLRLKRELAGGAAVWVAGYSNDVFGYLGSRRVITEGGYEGGGDAGGGDE